MEMGFLEEDGEGSPESCSTESEEEESVTERKAFWESQHQLLKGVLCRISSVELMIRNETERVLRESLEDGPKCVCGKGLKGGLCRNCLMRDVTDRLSKAGHDSGICKSKWRRTPDIPSGEHTYIDVVATSSSKKMSVRVVIELDFRAEFEMARASPEYKRLIDRLPHVFVGKAERLRSLIKILCEAAKKCMKENNMHMGPWRKHKYMQAKWLGKCERIAPVPPPPFSVSLSDSDDRQGEAEGFHAHIPLAGHALPGGGSHLMLVC
ncbi:hypothetical protein MRB53_015646 [Persea americana]|uniref:Uncharacterized protein n=1 Tax=Persea americana TaxID=3435 RepID=A0ACC2LZP8_PERAE|nr:hypothetical protein MRB53_015646 [Persea americana]